MCHINYIIAIAIVMLNISTFGKTFKVVRPFLTNSLTTGRRTLSTGSSVTSIYTSTETVQLNVDAMTINDFKGDVLIVPFYRPKAKENETLFTEIKNSIPADIDTNLVKLMEDLIDERHFKADKSSKVIVRLHGSFFPVKYLALVGLGKKTKVNESLDNGVVTTQAYGKMLSVIAKETNAQSLGVVATDDVSCENLPQLFIGLHDGLYQDNRFKKAPEGGHEKVKLSKLSILGAKTSVSENVQLAYSQSSVISSSVNFAKDLVGAPSNCKTPLVIADLARKLAKDHNLQCTILNKEDCLALNMGGYLGVQQGSKFEPQFIHLSYKSENPSPDDVKIALIGKGLTFDSGGYNLKTGPSSSIELMKFDMGGCAAVLGAAKAIGQLRPKNVEVHFITAVCENMISSEAMRPGDILTASNGKTIEVGNTDAEGRLTLADALVYADNLGVDKIIDLATLTGACVVGLGESIAGLYSPDLNFRNEIESAARRTNEGIWAMPLEESYRENFKSKLADLKNIGSKGGGSITAALFLQSFVEKAAWAHIDMAGPVWDTKASKPTGYGVKLLVDYVLNAKSKS